MINKAPDQSWPLSFLFIVRWPTPHFDVAPLCHTGLPGLAPAEQGEIVDHSSGAFWWRGAHPSVAVRACRSVASDGLSLSA